MDEFRLSFSSLYVIDLSQLIPVPTNSIPYSRNFMNHQPHQAYLTIHEPQINIQYVQKIVAIVDVSNRYTLSL